MPGHIAMTGVAGAGLAIGFSALMPDGVAVAEAGPVDWHCPVDPLEEEIIKAACTKRSREFRAGRACARRAVCEIGVGLRPIGRASDGRAVWPRGVVGSITHSDGFCAAVAARSSEFVGLGIDVEMRGRLEIKSLASIACEGECGVIDGVRIYDAVDWVTVLFSIKESVYKALPCNRGIGFQDIRIDLVEKHVFTATVAGLDDVAFSRMLGRVSLFSEYVISGLAVRASAPQHRRKGASI